MAAAEPQPFSQLVKKVRTDFFDKLTARGYAAGGFLPLLRFVTNTASSGRSP